MPPTFSIITPTYNRWDGRLERCLESVEKQSYLNWQHVVIDDGSTDDTWEGLAGYFITSAQIKHSGRVIARNTGMEMANGDWICWLDSDDAYDPMYLSTFAHHIKREPEAKLWVCGAIVHGMVKEDGVALVPAWTKIRPAWEPPLDTETGEYKHFKSGKVGTGMFVFHRSCLEKTGLMPPWKNHDQIAGGADEWLGYETGYKSGGPWCGNPFGDDWIFFRKLTMFYKVHKIEAALYVQYTR